MFCDNINSPSEHFSSDINRLMPLTRHYRFRSSVNRTKNIVFTFRRALFYHISDGFSQNLAQPNVEYVKNVSFEPFIRVKIN